MAPNLRVSLVQTATAWHDARANCEAIGAQLAVLKDQTDLVLLPEMWSTGFSMASAEIAQDMQGASVRWMLEQAQTLGAVVAGSVVIKEDGHYFNRFVAAYPNGKLCTYDKRHLFRMAGEHESYHAGGAKVVFEIEGWRVCPLICYDLRFPVWFRNQDDYDLLVCVANWPAARREVWNTLLRARGIENQVYVAGVNIVGQDGNDVAYSGGSAVYFPDGEVLCERFDDPAVCTVVLEADLLTKQREQFPVWQDADVFSLENQN